MLPHAHGGYLFGRTFKLQLFNTEVYPYTTGSTTSLTKLRNPHLPIEDERAGVAKLHSRRVKNPKCHLRHIPMTTASAALVTGHSLPMHLQQRSRSATTSTATDKLILFSFHQATGAKIFNFKLELQ